MFSKIILVYVGLFVASSQPSNIPMFGWILSDAIWGIVELALEVKLVELEPELSLTLINFLHRKPFDNSPQSSDLPISTDEEYVNYEYEEYEDEEYEQ